MLNLPHRSLDVTGRTEDDTSDYPTSGVQHAVRDPDGSHHLYGDQSWVFGGGPISDGSHPDGRIQARTVTIIYGEWADLPDQPTR